MMKKLIRIVSSGGTALGTRVFCGNEELKNISNIEIQPIEVGGIIEAKITFCSVELDIEATQKTTKETTK